MKIKRMLAMLLTLAMLFTMASPALADEAPLSGGTDEAEFISVEEFDEEVDLVVSDEADEEVVEAEILDLADAEARDEEPAPQAAEIAEEEEVAYEVTSSDRAAMAGTLTIKFYPNYAGANQTMQDQVSSDDRFSLSENEFTRTGYTFTGWNTESGGTGTPYTDKQEVNNRATSATTVTLYAQWQGKSITVTFDANGGEGTISDKTLIYDDANPVNLPTNTSITRTGYAFAGWNDVADGSGNALADGADVKNYIDAATVTSVTFYAQWTPNTYYVAFDKNEASATGTMEKMTFTHDQAQNLTSNAFEYENYDFAGWSVEPGQGKEVKFTDGQEVNNLTNGNGNTITLYAQWTLATIKISFEANGGTGRAMADQLLSDTTPSTLTPNAYARIGYEFAGWNDVADGSGNAFADEAASTELFAKYTKPCEVTLYAQWTPNTYYIAFDGNGATSGTMDAQTFEFGTAQNLTKNAFERTGYHFAGWAVEAVPASGARIYADEESINNFTGGKDVTITLYAQWTPNNYKIAFDKNAEDATGTMNDQDFVFGTAQQLTQNGYSRTGYTFDGWCVDKDGNGTIYADQASINNFTAGQNNTVTLYAQWKGIERTIAFHKNSNDATGATAPVTYTVGGEAVALTANGFEREGYHFEKWNTNAGGTGTDYADGATVSVENLPALKTADVTLYAVWTANTAHITYKPNGGTGDDQTQDVTYAADWQTVKAGSIFTAPTGKQFAGWNTAADGTGTDFTAGDYASNVAKLFNGDVTLYAQWTGLEYMVVFYANDGTDKKAYQEHIKYDTDTKLNANAFTREYYHFDSWNTVAAPTEATPGVKLTNEDEADKAYDAIKGYYCGLHAQWAPNTATITFDPNGGTGSMDPQTVKYAANGKWTPNKNADDEGKALITYEGRVFVGWNTAADGNGTSYVEGQEYEVTALVDKVDADKPVTLYAVWDNAKYEIVFHTNASDATGEMAPMHGCESNTDVKLPACGFTRPHYTFLGWTLEPGEKTPEYEDGANINLAIDNGEVVHLYAQWEAFKYNVQFYQNADDPNLVYENLNTQFTYDGDSNVLPAAQELEGFAFVGWSTVPNPGENDPIYPAGATVTENFTDDPATIVKFYAIWDGNTYTVHFEPNVPENEEGEAEYEGAMSDVDFVFGEKNPLPEIGFRRNGYKFVGWTTVPGGLVPEYTGTEVDKDLPLNENGEAVLYAVWEYNVYHVEFDRNGENVRGGTKGQEFTLGGSKVLNANGFINEHYEFLGWSLKKGAGTADIEDQATVDDTDLGNPKADDTVILYAQWKLEEFDITWKNDDGSKLPEATSTPDKWEYGKRPVYPGAKNPESSHKNDPDFTYTFVGWKDKTEQLWTGDLPPATEDATYTAAYDVKSKFYTMSFMDDGKPLAVLTQAEGTPITPPANPTKDGYEFTGWKCTDTTVTSVPAKMPAKDLTFEAQWNKVLTIKDVRIEPQQYTGSELKPVPTVTYQGKTLKEGTDYTVTLPEGRCVDVGEYDVTITGIGDYTGTVVAKFIIYPKGNIVVTAVEQTKKYGDPDPQLTYTVKIDDKTYTNNEPEAAKAVSGKLDREPGEDVGIYAITQGTLKGNPNYEITFVGNYLEITKADSFVIDEPIGKTELVYDGTDQPLVKAGTAEGGMLQYSLDGVNFSTTIPTGNDADTYTVSYKVEGDKNHSDTKPVEIKVTIAPKPVIVTGVKADDKVYDGSARTTITGTPIIRGLATGDIVVVMPGEANFIDGKAGYEKLVRYSGFTLTDVDAKNYVLQAQPAPTTANIIPKNVSLSWGDPELIYNGQYQAPEAKIEGVVEGDDCSVKVEGKQKDVGEYTASAAGLTGKDKSNYKVVSTITTTPYTIGQKSVTITGLTAKDKVYDGNTEAVILGLESAVIEGKESGDIVTAVPGYATFDDPNVGEKKVVTFDGFTLGGRDAKNYILSAQPAAVKADITQKEVGLTWTDTEFVYDGKAHQPTATATGLVEGDTCEVKVTGAQTAAGTYTATATSLSNPNYKLPADPTTQFTIGKKEVTITADAKTKVYGSADPALTYTVEGLVKGEKLTGELKRKEGENVGTYAIEQGTLKASDNYDVTYVGADFTITKKALTVKAAAKSKVYGDKDPEFTYSVSGLVKDDKVTGELEREPGENVGKYAIKQGTLTAGDNYDMTFIGADLTITQKDLTVVADAKSKTYGDKDPEFTYTVTGLVGFDEMTGALTREPGENVGTYAILQGTLTAGGNYKLHYKGANLTIGKKALKVKADAQSKIYGEKDPELTYSVEGLVSGDKLTGALTRAKGENVGTYAITQGSLTAGGNYNLSFTGSTLTISRKALTVKADAKSKTYGDKDPEFTYVATGLVGNETLTGALSRVSGENVGKYAIQQGTLKASDNYTLTFIGADLTILPKKIVPTMDLDPERFVYDSQPKEPKVTVMDGDEEVPETEYTVEYEDNIEPGTGKARATSKEGGNYEFDIEKTFVIEPAGPTELLLAKATTSGDTTIVYTWNKISEADGYEFYMSKCNANGKKYEVKLIKTIKGNKTFKFTKKNLKKGVAYKAKVMAYKMIGKKKVYLSESPMVHAYAGGKSKTETNAKTLTLKTTKFSLKKGKTGTIKATVTKAYSKLTLLAHTEKLRYYSSDTSIATVSDKGVITARGKGTCTIAVLTHNGICKKVKVTVK